MTDFPPIDGGCPRQGLCAMFIATNMPGTCTDRFPGMIADTDRYRQGYTVSVKTGNNAYKSGINRVSLE